MGLLEQVPPPSAEAVLRAAEIVHPEEALLPAALEVGVGHLVTLDRHHFLDSPEVARRSRVRIGSPGEFLAWFRALLDERSGLIL